MTAIITTSSTPIFQVSTSSGFTVIGDFDTPGFIKIDGDTNGTIIGGMESDIIEGGSGTDIISSGSGDDILSGNAGDDIIKAGAGDDVITGGTGADSMTGGTGDDTFVISSADLDGSLDSITDYTLGENVIFQGIGASAQVSYDVNSGMISINGKDVLNIGEGLDIGSDDIKNTTGDTWEIF